MNLVLSSTIVRKYLKPFPEVKDAGPHKLKCNNLRGSKALEFDFLKVMNFSFADMHHKMEETKFYLNLENYYKTIKLLLALEDEGVPFF